MEFLKYLYINNWPHPFRSWSSSGPKLMNLSSPITASMPGRLEEAVAAYRAALEERTRERVPLDWAAIDDPDRDDVAFVQELIELRRRHAILRWPSFLHAHGQPLSSFLAARARPTSATERRL